jgi:hypothetical protein
VLMLAVISKIGVGFSFKELDVNISGCGFGQKI